MIDPRQITRENFFLNPSTLTIQFLPLSPAFYLSLELFTLYEAFSFAFARQEGPFLATRVQPPWTPSLTIHPSYVSNSDSLTLANFWQTYIPWFWENTRDSPLPEFTLLAMLQDIKQILCRATNIHVSSSVYGLISSYYDYGSCSIRPVAEVTFQRTDFLAPPIIVNTQALGLQMRLSFDAKRRPRKQWSNSSYLAQHKKLLEAYKAKHNSDDLDADPSK